VRITNNCYKMAGDKIVDCTQNGNSEKISENGDLSLSLNLEDDFVESIEYVPCPEFQFSVSQSVFFFFPSIISFCRSFASMCEFVVIIKHRVRVYHKENYVDRLYIYTYS